jgi:hypothetical protein
VKRFGVALFSLLLAIAPVSAQGWMPLVSDPVADSTDTGCSIVSGTTVTFTAKGIGNAAANRVTVVSINWGDSTSAGTAELTGVTIGGVAANRAVRASGDNQNSNSEIWFLQTPTGTSANIAITSSTTIDAATIDVYRLVGYNSLVPVASTTGTTSASQAYTNKQVALAAGSRTVNVSTSLSNMTNDFSSACGSSLWGVHASQKLNGTSTLTTSINPTSNNPKIALAVWGVNPPPPSCTSLLSDQYWLNTVLLMPFQGANGSVTAPGMSDVSPSAHGAAVVGGNAAISTTQSSFDGGCSSLALDGDHDYVTFPDSTDWHLSTGQFTVEGWFYFSAAPTNALLLAQWPSGWALFITGNNLILRASSGGDTTSYTFSATLNQWYAFAVDRDASNVARVYVNGIMVSKTTGYTANLSGSTGSLMIGSLVPGGFGGFDISGFVGAARITKGLGRYVSDNGYSAARVPFPTQ